MQQADLGRLATIQPDGTPQNSPVGFTYNEELGTIDIAGYQMSKSQKFRNIARNHKVAFVVDDIPSRDPWRVRCLEIRGTAEQAAARRGAAANRNGDALDDGHHPHHAAPDHQLRDRRPEDRTAPAGRRRPRTSAESRARAGRPAPQPLQPR